MIAIVSPSALLFCAISQPQPFAPTSPDHTTILGGGGPTEHPEIPCITPQARALITAQIAAYRAAHPTGYSERTDLLYHFFPQGGNYFDELDSATFVDLDPTSPGFHDFACTNLTYDGHAGVDSALRSFGELRIGVPVFAALPGTVMVAIDGDPSDENTTPNGQPGNYIIIDNGSGRETWYFHLKNGSVAVTPGQHVVAGQQIALTASSGNSAGPHLHFESHQNGAVYEPFAGACRPGPSGWANQPAIRRDLYFTDCAFSSTDMNTVPGWPQPSPRTGQLGFNDNTHYLWVMLHNLPANSTFRFRYIRPSGALEFQTTVYNFNNSAFYPRAWYWFYGFYIPDMHNSAGLGTWRMQMDVNGVQYVDAPVVVRAAQTPDFNRPPVALNAIAFDPPAPASADVLFCRITTSLLYDDPDYDIVRYDYNWTVNGVPVRHVVSAGHADAIPSGAAAPGSFVRCTVTPNDGRVNGPAGTAVVRVAGGCVADFDDGSGMGNPDGGVTIDDLLYYLALFAQGDALADVDDGSGTGTMDGGVTIDDLLYFLTRFSLGC